MIRILAIATVLMLTACASPTMKMSDQQIVSLNDDQLCNYKNNYREEPRLNAELAARGIAAHECSPYYRECRRRGNAPGSETLNFCIDVLRDNERLRRERDWYDDRAFLYGHGHRGGGLGVGLGF